jgi:D-tyrosyl-tRNA(Tyr) deacylase
MRAVIQRVSKASVSVQGDVVASMNLGLMVLLGVAQNDTASDAEYLAEKISGLRIFEDEQHKMNLSVENVKGAILVVSQFTLLGDCRKGRRPGFSEAAPPAMADQLYQKFVHILRLKNIDVFTGVFQAEMDVALVNKGPVTILLDSRKQF